MSWSIKIENVGKKYLLRSTQPLNNNLREDLTIAAKKSISRLNPFGKSISSSRTQQVTDFWALKNINLEIQKGEILGIIGRNGAGKSTLLKILSRIVPPTCGKIRYRGRMASLLEVGTGFHRELSGRENIFLNGAILGMRRSEIIKKFDEIVDFAEVEKFIDTPVKYYSSGMYVRLAFAIAAQLECEILIIDEILAVGDMAFQEKCLDKMHRISKTGRTVIFVSHNIAAITALCTRGIFLDTGTIKFSGPVNEAAEKYLEEATSPKGLSWDVSNTKRQQENYGELIKIMKVELCPNQPQGFGYGEDLRFRAWIHSNTNQSHLFTGAGIDDAYGKRLATCDAHEKQFQFSVERGKTYQVELKIPKPHLNPGRYLLSLSVFSGKQYYDVVFHAGEFEISSLSFDSGEYYESDPTRGPLRLPYEWSHIKS